MAYIVWNGRPVSTAFPYLQVLLQGRPRHGADGFTQRHPRMERSKRAKIFAPFDALDGYGGSVREKNAVYVDKLELDESQREEVNRALLALHALTRTRRLAQENQPQAAITYFVLCRDRHSLAFEKQGQYLTATGTVSKVDAEITRTVKIGDTLIPFDDIFRIMPQKKAKRA